MASITVAGIVIGIFSAISPLIFHFIYAPRCYDMFKRVRDSCRSQHVAPDHGLFKALVILAVVWAIAALGCLLYILCTAFSTIKAHSSLLAEVVLCLFSLFGFVGWILLSARVRQHWVDMKELPMIFRFQPSSPAASLADQLSDHTEDSRVATAGRGSPGRRSEHIVNRPASFEGNDHLYGGSLSPLVSSTDSISDDRQNVNPEHDLEAGISESPDEGNNFGEVSTSYKPNVGGQEHLSRTPFEPPSYYTRHSSQTGIRSGPSRENGHKDFTATGHASPRFGLEDGIPMQPIIHDETPPRGLQDSLLNQPVGGGFYEHIDAAYERMQQRDQQRAALPTTDVADRHRAREFKVRINNP